MTGSAGGRLPAAEGLRPPSHSSLSWRAGIEISGRMTIRRFIGTARLKTARIPVALSLSSWIFPVSGERAAFTSSSICPSQASPL